MKKILFLMALVVLSGCDQKIAIERGELPESLVAAAQPYLGTYVGKFDLRPAEFTLRMEGSRVVLESPKDPLYGNCGASIGSLQQIFVHGRAHQALADLVFAFDPGQCDEILGRTLTVQLPKRTSGWMYMSVFDSFERCDAVSCHEIFEPHYIWGRLKKVD